VSYCPCQHHKNRYFAYPTRTLSRLSLPHHIARRRCWSKRSHSLGEYFTHLHGRSGSHIIRL